MRSAAAAGVKSLQEETPIEKQTGGSVCGFGWDQDFQ
jgi:hypothetical protein